MRIEKSNHNTPSKTIIPVEEEVLIPGTNMILEAGDHVEFLSEQEEDDPKVSKMIKDLADSYGDSNEDQGKMVQLLKGLAFSDDPKANKFMKALDKWTTQQSEKMSESVTSRVNEKSADEWADEEYELLQKAEKKGIDINYKDKYVKGQRASGPRNYHKANVETLQQAIDNNEKSVTLWRG